MSQINELLADMMAKAISLGGSHLTREAYEATISLFIAFVVTSGYTHMRCVKDIHGKHFRAFVEHRVAIGMEKRTICNNTTHLRRILRAAKCYGVADAKELSNRSLGIGGASRKGTKVPLTAEEYKRVRELSFALGRPGFAAMLRLEDCIGLRGNEAIFARTDVLERWLREIETGAINVYEGTKGGRRRTVTVLDKEEAIAAVEEALAVTRKQGSFLVIRANGKPCGGLKEARSIYHGWAHRAGFQPHAARYAFAQMRQATLQAQGLSEREADLATSHDLGHGDGRGRWVRLVYGFSPSAMKANGGDSCA
jgi:integrase